MKSRASSDGVSLLIRQVLRWTIAGAHTHRRTLFASSTGAKRLDAYRAAHLRKI